MEYEELKKRWFEHKTGILEPCDLTQCGADSSCVYYYECPCGGEDHTAMRYWIDEGYNSLRRELSPVLNCFVANQQWLVKPMNIAELIRVEEESFITRLEKADLLIPKIINKLGRSSKTLLYLKETHGIPIDVTEDWLVTHPS